MELWRWIAGFEDVYEVSNKGRVRSVDRFIECSNGLRKRYQGCLLKLRPNVGGYLSLRLGRRYPRMVHAIVAEAFIGPRPEGLQVCHRDGNKGNNGPGNLRYGTPLSNQHDRKAHGTQCRGADLPQTKLTEKSVREIKKQRGVETQMALSRRFCVSAAAIQAIHDGRTWKHIL